MRKTLSVAIALLLSVALTACDTSKKPKSGEPKKPAGEQMKAPESNAQTNCPVMGGKINKDIYADHDGKRVYFCCADCVDTFKKDPAKYIKKLEDEGVVLAKAPAAEEEKK